MSITNIEFDGVKWHVVINDKYEGVSFMIFIALYIAMWRWLIGLTNGEEK